MADLATKLKQLQNLRMKEMRNMIYITNDTYGGDERKKLSSLGSENYITYATLSALEKFTLMPPGENSTEDEINIIEHDISLIAAKNILLDNIIDEKGMKQTQNIKKEDIIAIEELVKSLHDESLTDQSTVYELWSDGEILSTKGGALYGKRTFFTVLPPIILPHINFPLKKKEDAKLSYAILTQDNARKIYKKLLSLKE